MGKQTFQRLFETLLLWAFIWPSIIASSQSLQQSYIQLQDRLRNCPAIQHKMPPDVAGSGLLELHFEPFQILSVDELHQAVEVSTLLTLHWTFPDCAWNASDYNDIWRMEMATSDVWTPDVISPKSSRGSVLSMPNSLEISHDGLVEVYIPSALTTTCYLDLLRYPFDEHNCSIPFIDTSGQDIVPMSHTPIPVHIDQFFSTAVEWDLLEHGCERIQKYLNYTECWFTMRRHSLFYMATIVSPTIFLSLMTILVFCIPAESGEKMSFIISIFVSGSVLINFFVNVIPRSMNQLPRILVVILGVVTEIGLTAAATTIVLNRYHREQREKGLPLNNPEVDPTGEPFHYQDVVGKVMAKKRTVTSQNMAGTTTLTSDVTTVSSTPVEQKCLPRDAWEDEDVKSLTGSRNRVADLNEVNNCRKCTMKKRIVEKLQTLWNCLLSMSHTQLDRIFFFTFSIATLMMYIFVLWV